MSAEPNIYREVVNYKITWFLENVYMCGQLLETDIRGPDFRSKIPSFPWVLKLGQSRNPERKGICLFIQAIEGAKVVNLRVLVRKNSNSQLSQYEEKRRVMSREWESPILISNDDFKLEATLNNRVTQFWEIQVHLMWHEIIETGLITETFTSDALSGLMRKKEVGNDLNHFCRFSDVFITNGEKKIRAHKSIIAVRCPSLIEKIVNNDIEVEDDMIPSKDPDLINAFLRYLYTGDVGCISENEPLPIGIYECAQRMNASYLQWATSPREFHGKSSVNLRVVRHESVITHLEIEKITDTPLIIKSDVIKSAEETFVLNISTNPPEGDTTSASISVLLKLEEIVEGESIYVVLELSLKRGEEDMITEKRIVDNLKQNGSIGFPKLLSMDEILQNENHNLADLRFTCKITYSRSRQEPDNIVEKVPEELLTDCDPSKSRLSYNPFSKIYHGWISLIHDLGSLLLSENYSDCTIVIGNDRLPAHRVILAARSEYFSHVFHLKEEKAESSRGMEIFIEKDAAINAQLMKILLKEIYTGSAEILDYLAKDIHKLAKFFGLPKLEMACLEKIEKLRH